MELAVKQSTKNKFGQYFTPKVVADFMIEMADISEKSRILEPSCGEGVFLDLLQQKGFKDLTAFEIDPELAQEFTQRLNLRCQLQLTSWTPVPPTPAQSGAQLSLF